jgi:hypothetical protein
VEVVDAMEANGLLIYEKMPAWMEEPLWSLMSVHGFKTLANYLRAKQFEDVDPIIDTLSLALENKIDGYNR